MRKIFRYQEFINETMGVSPSFTFAAELATGSLQPLLLQYKGHNTDFDGELKLSGEDIKADKNQFPIREIKIGISSEIIDPASVEEDPDFDNFYINGVYDGGSFLMREDGTISFTIGAKITISQEAVDKINKKDKALIERLRTEMESTITHELTHAYEDYMRRKNKNMELTIHDTKDFLFDMVSNIMLGDNEQLHLPKIIGQLLYNIYTSATYEVNARVAQSYSLVRSIKDPHKRWEIIKKSHIYKIADELESFDAKKTYDTLYADALKDLKTDAKVKEWMESFMQMITKTFLQGNGGLKNDALRRVAGDMNLMEPDKKKLDSDKKVAEIVSRHSDQVKKEIGHKDLLGFMKLWEKKFHASGQDMKYRLGKITMLDIA